MAAPGYNGCAISLDNADKAPASAVDDAPVSAGTCGVMPLASWDEAGAPLDAVVGTELNAGSGATFPLEMFGIPAADAGAEKGDVTGGTAVCTPEVFGIAGTRGKENSSFAGGSADAAVGDALFSPSGK